MAELPAAGGTGAVAAVGGSVAARAAGRPGHPRPGRGPIRPHQRPAHGHLPTGPVVEHPGPAAAHDDGLHQRRYPRPPPGQGPRRGGGLRPRRRRGNTPFRRQRATRADHRERRRSRVHESGGRDETRPGPLSRGRRQADRDAERRQPEPRQRGGAGPGALGGGRGHRRRPHPLPYPRRDHRRAGGPAAGRPPRRTVRPPRGGYEHGRGHGPRPRKRSRPADPLGHRRRPDRHLERPAGGLAAGQESVLDPAEDRGRQFLHLRGPLHPRPPRRRRLRAKQPGHGVYPRAGQGPGAADRRLRAPRRVRRARGPAAAAGAGGRGAAEQPALLDPGRVAALRHGVAGQRAPRALQRGADRHARAEHAADGSGARDARRPQQLRRRRLDEHRSGTGHAGRFPDQELQGGPPRRWR